MTFTAAAVNVGMWRFDLSSDELWATSHCRAIFGLGADVGLSRETILQAIQPDDRELALTALREAASSTKPTTCDVRVVLHDSEVRWIRIRARSGDPSIRASQVSGIFIDVTDQKAAEADAALQRQEVTHLMRVSALGQLSGAIAHEINQPLTAILSNAQAALHMIQERSPNLEEIRDAIADIVHEDNRAAEVIERLRGLLRKGEVTTEIVDLNSLVISTVALLNGELINRSVKIELGLTECLPGTSGDPVQFQQVVLNLLMNAMDAMVFSPPAERIITVATRVRGNGSVDMIVTDRGPGFDQADEVRVFQPFYTTKAHGLGLGLTICSTIAQAHGGQLTLARGASGGAVATLSLPARKVQIAAQ